LGDDGLVSSDSEISAATARDAFERLTQRRLDRAYRFAATILGDEDEAQDAVHDAAVRAWQRWASLRDADRFDAWFDRLRQWSSLRHVASVYEHDGQEVAEAVSDGDVLIRAFTGLTTDHKIVIALRYLDDQSIEEIAARTGVRAGTVKSRLHYGLRELRAGYEAAERSGSRSDR
jgi:RNA polymerase sigma-70 factor (ECF subfamily)